MQQEETTAAVLKEELTEEMEEMLACLKEKDREIFYKLYVEQQDIDEIAKDTGMSKGTIYKRVQRGKTKLRKLFGEKGGV